MLTLRYNEVYIVEFMREDVSIVNTMHKLHKLICLIICMAIAVSVLATPQTSAFAANKTGTVNIATGYLKIRKSAPDGEEIGQLLNGDTVVILDSTSISGWYKIDFNGIVGYSSSNYIVINQPETPEAEYKPDADFEAYMNSQGFPESYKPYLRKLHAAHPNWIFKGLKTGLNWSTVINAEMRLGRSLIQKLNSYPESYYSYQQGAFNPETNKFTVFDGSNWIQASQSLIEYAVDPRNYLNETYIFSMLGLNHSSSETIDGINSILKGTFMEGAYPDFEEFATYADAFLAAAKSSDVSSYHLASSCRQENGTKDGTALTNGTVSGYEGYYNFFNVGAYNSGDNSNVVNGAIYAKSKGWDTQYKSILGGAEFIGSGYIKIGQNTKYLHKFDLIPYGGLYNHQYMTNILAAFSEGSMMKQSYIGDTLESNHTFNIPIFENMPTDACPKPTGAGDNNYLLSSLTVEGQNLSPKFETYTNSYELVVGYDVKSVNISAKAMSNQASVSGIGNHDLNVGDNTISITVTAKTGTKNTYTLLINRQTENVALPPETTPDPSIEGEYSIGEYITGIKPQTNVAAFIEKLGVKNGTAKVFASNGNELTSDALIGSDCKVTIYKDGKEFANYKTVVYGDMNGDGNIKTVDLFIGQRHIFGTAKLSGAKLEAADINHDGNVKTVDLFMGQRHIFGTYTIDQKG